MNIKEKFQNAKNKVCNFIEEHPDIVVGGMITVLLGTYIGINYAEYKSEQRKQEFLIEQEKADKEWDQNWTEKYKAGFDTFADLVRDFKIEDDTLYCIYDDILPDGTKKKMLYQEVQGQGYCRAGI